MRRGVIIVAAAVVFAAGCGGDDDAAPPTTLVATTAPATSTTTTTTTAPAPVTTAPSVVAIKLCDQLAGADPAVMAALRQMSPAARGVALDKMAVVCPDLVRMVRAELLAGS